MFDCNGSPTVDFVNYIFSKYPDESKVLGNIFDDCPRCAESKRKVRDRVRKYRNLRRSKDVVKDV